MLEALFAKDFEKYISTASENRGLWLFVHVPKTAGSSMAAEVRELLQPYYSIELDYGDPTCPNKDKFNRPIAEFLAQNETRHFRFCRGHVNAQCVEVIRAAIPETQCFTMLRDPLKRLVSDYRFQRSAMNKGREKFIAETPTFEAYIERKHVHNKMALNLAPRAMVLAGDVAACVDYITETYAFVGVQEMYSLSLRLLTLLMGAQRLPEAKLRVNDASENNVELSAELTRSLRKLNAVDQGIFTAFRARWQAIQEDLVAYLRVHHPQGGAMRPNLGAAAPGSELNNFTLGKPKGQHQNRPLHG